VETETEILATSAAWDAALVDNDAGAVASFMADEWVFVSPSGITPKAALIEWIATGRLAHHAMEAVGPPRVAIHGDVVIVTARKRAAARGLARRTRRTNGSAKSSSGAAVAGSAS
jgi:ketosteroid isomerase-like protein